MDLCLANNNFTVAAAAGALPSRRSEIGPDDNLKYICEVGGQTLENWEKLDMGFFLNAT